ncbi:TPA: UbiA family prenyltransferase [Candidatus Bathyarchaeota archaeon]|nr:UbiA family prenyltransferase [Candidatus Bathyarchaeota archaeon]
MILEICLTLVLVSAFALYQEEPILLALWIVGIALGIAFSAPPLRLKARFWIGPVSQMLVLAVFPVLFAYYAFASEMNAYFLMALVGLSLTVYGVIVPTEIRDFFGDKAFNIQTLTVRLGLSRAALMGIVVLSAGAALTGAALFLEWYRLQLLPFGILVLAIPLVVVFVLLKLWKIYSLTRSYENAEIQDRSALEREITDLSSENPKWIMIVTQTYSILSILLLVSRFIF